MVKSSHWSLLCALAVAVATDARADLAPPPPPPPTPTTVPAVDVDGADVSVSKAPRPRPNQAILCGCASSRFLGLKNRDPVVVGDGSLSVWLHGESHVEGFTSVDGKLGPADLPFSIDVDERSTAGAGRMVRLRATGVGEGQVGIVRPKDTIPRDVVAATFAPGTSSTAAATAPVVTAMWLAPVEARERRDCGPWLTERLAFETDPTSVPVEAFTVTDLDSGAVTLVDARHVGAFGIGRVALCDHGFGVDNTPQRLEIAPVSAAGVAAKGWGFAHDGSGTTPVTRLSSPPTADAAKLADPFPVPGEPTTHFSWLSVGGLWILLPSTAIVAALLGFLAWRMKRRRLAEVVCAACHRTVPVDVLDEKTDGFFCPHCGAAGMWKGKRVDVDVTHL